MSTHSKSPEPDNAAGSAWTEPPWCGFIETTGDALLILEAARRGLIPRVTRRLVDAERRMIASGSVFVFDEEESGIKRWTDGFYWSPSRILGNFLLYRETDKRGPSRGKTAAPTPPAGAEGQAGPSGAHNEFADGDGRPVRLDAGQDKHERALVGSLTSSYKFKKEGLMKKTFSLTIGGVAQHLISYYLIEDVEKGVLRTPSSVPELAALDISPEYLDKTHFRTPPRVEVGPDGIPRYKGEADELLAEAGGPSPLLSSAPRRAKRFEPYAGGAAKKRSAKAKPAQPPPPEVPPMYYPYAMMVTPPGTLNPADYGFFPPGVIPFPYALMPAMQAPPPPALPPAEDAEEEDGTDEDSS